MCAAKILFKLSGSIAAWKACAVISRLVQDGHEVRAVATDAALRFVGSATLEGLTGRRVASDLWEAGAAMDHINLVKWADVVVLCPATANTINRLASGAGEDLLSALFLAHDWVKPYLVAPAMNPAMWSHPATIESVDRLRSWGVRVLPVGSGRLACGDEGDGRLIEPDQLLGHIRAALPQSALHGRRLRVLVTSGGTQEPIDGVRSLGNFSSGETGAVIAEAFASSGHEVTLLRAKTAVPVTAAVSQRTYVTFADLEAALANELQSGHYDAVVHAAAVGDYSVAAVETAGEPVAPGQGKIPSGQDVTIRLRSNIRLVDRLRDWSRNASLRVAAFKLTNGAGESEVRLAVETLFAHSRADFVIHNDLALRDAGTGRFPAAILRKSGSRVEVSGRAELARALVDALEEEAAETAANPTT